MPDFFSFFKPKEKTIKYFEVQKLLYDAGFRKESTIEGENRGHYTFSKHNYVLHSKIGDGYVLINTLPLRSVVKEYSEQMTHSEVVNAIEIVSQNLKPKNLKQC